MEICEMLKRGKAYRIFLSKQIAEQMTKGTGRKYNEGDELILCEIGGQCFYGGARIYDAHRKREDSASEMVHICELGKRTKLETKVIVN
ncbi:hypothetical protein ES703_51157 [subsurface metagenome]